MKKILFLVVPLLLGAGCQKNISPQIQNDEVSTQQKNTVEEQIQIQPEKKPPESPAQIPLPISSSPKHVDQFVVHFNNIENNEVFHSGKNTKLTFHIDGKNNAPIEHVDRYGNGWGKLTFQKSDVDSLTEAVPEEIKLTKVYNDISFFADFPAPGIYVLNLEFKYGQKIFTTPFTVSVQ